jgi:hypothetical protein
MVQESSSSTGRPCIESVSDGGEVQVRLANGHRSVIRVPVEQVDQLRRAAFLDERRQPARHRFTLEG